MSASFTSRFISILGGRFSTIFATFITTPIFVRLLDPSEYGEFAFSISFFGIILIVTSPGIFGSTRKFISENRESTEWEQNVYTFYLVLGLLLAVCTATVVVLFGRTGLPQLLFDIASSELFLLIGLLLIAQQLLFIVRGTLMGVKQESRSELSLFLNNVVFVLSSIYLATLDFGAEGLILGKILGAIVGVSLGSYFLTSHVRIVPTGVSFPADFPKMELISFNFYSILFTSMTVSLYNVDIILVQYYLNSTQTAYYKAALLIAEFLWFVPNSLQTLLLHSSSEMWSNEEIQKISELSSKITRYNLLLTSLFSIGIVVLSSEFIQLYYGADYMPAVLPLIILIPGAFGFAIARPIFSISQGKGEMRKLVLGTSVPVAINILLNVILIPQFGLLGAAVSTSIGYGMMVVVHTYLALSIGFNPIESIRFDLMLVAGILTLVVIYLLNGVIPSNIVSLVVVPPVGFIVYSLVCIKLGLIRESELSSLRSRILSWY